MADYGWSWSTCRGDVQWYGIPGSGCYYWTARFGQHWVGGTVYQWFAWYGYECPGGLGPPINPYGDMDGFAGGGMGQWFENGCIMYRYATGRWTVYFGQYGQLNGRLVEEVPDVSQFKEGTAPPGDWTVLEPEEEAPPAPEPPEG